LGLDYIHRCCGIIHTDLKPENIRLICRYSHSSGDLRIMVKITNFKNAALADYCRKALIDIPRYSQMQQYRSPEIILGAKWRTSADIWSVACIIFELVTGGDYLFPVPDSQYNPDEEHIAEIVQLMGKMPKSVALTGKYSSGFFDAKGKLLHSPKIRYWPLDAVLHYKYLLPKPDADDLAAFLTPMLSLNPAERANASDLLHHHWL